MKQKLDEQRISRMIQLRASGASLAEIARVLSQEFNVIITERDVANTFGFLPRALEAHDQSAILAWIAQGLQAALADIVAAFELALTVQQPELAIKAVDTRIKLFELAARLAGIAPANVQNAMQVNFVFKATEAKNQDRQ